MIPGSEADYHIEADVNDFSFDGFTLAGIPLSFAFDLDEADTSDFEGSFSELQDAIAQLSEGATALHSNSGSVASGLDSLASQNATIVAGSNQIKTGIQSMYDVSLTLAQGSSLYASGLLDQYVQAAAAEEYYNSLAAQKQQEYALALSGAGSSLGNAELALIQAYQALSMGEEGTALLQASLDSLTLELSTTGSSVAGIQSAVGSTDSPGLVSYQAQASAYGASAATAAGFLDSYNNLDAGIQGLSGVLPEFSSLYGTFDDGLNQYVSGVAALDEGYPALDAGMGDLASGAEALRLETRNLDQDMIESLKEELTQRLNPDLELHSFADGSNTAVENVQFIIRTDATEKPVEDPVEDEQLEEQTFWTRLIALFEEQ